MKLSHRLPMLSLLPALVLAFAPLAAEAGKEQARRIHGEYRGQVDGQGKAIQARAVGGGQLELLIYDHGLPGEKNVNIAGQATARREDGRTTASLDNTTRLVWDEQAILWRDSERTRGKLKKIHRKSPTLGQAPPDEAVVLFDGTEASLENWNDGQITDNGLLKEGTRTANDFGDFTLHLEFRVPFQPEADNQGRGNSGLYIHNCYEVQILDSFGQKPRDNGCGSLYRFKTAKPNMTFPPGRWQTYDIEFTAPRFNDEGQKIENARVTVRHNGVRVHDDVELPDGTGAGSDRSEKTAGPLVLQEHDNPVRFRNIWLVRK
jgi:hypothetical protein